MPELVECLARAGRAGSARERVAVFVARAGHKGQPWALARARRRAALLADDDEAAVLFQQALDLHAASPDRFEEARTRLVYGEHLRRRRRRVEAAGQLRAALELFEHLGATPWSDRATAELAATGERVHRRAEGPIAALTERELQIGLLLADGMTTRQAAAALFVSPKTVEYHLRHVYTKLGIGVTCRAGGRAAGVRHGLTGRHVPRGGSAAAGPGGRDHQGGGDQQQRDHEEGVQGADLVGDEAEEGRARRGRRSSRSS